MKRIWIMAMFLLVVSMGASALDCKAAIEGVRDSWLTHWKAKQLDEVMTMYAEDATLLSDDGHLHVGRSQIRTYFKTLMESGTAVSVKSAGVVCSSDTGYDAGTYERSAPGAMQITGRAQMSGSLSTAYVIGGNYVVVLRQESGKWLIVQQASVHLQ